MNLTIKGIAAKFKGFIEGNAEVTINQLGKIETAKSGSITFLANKKYAKFLYITKASAVIVQKEFILKTPIKCTLVRVDDPYAVFTNLLLDEAKNRENLKTEIHISAVISPLAKLGEDIFIGANTVIGESTIESGVKIGANCVIGDQVYIAKNTKVYPCVSILDESEVGSSCIIHSGVVIGSDGFGFAPDKKGVYIKIPQIGNVIIKNNVSVGALTSIDRATLGSTIIHEGVKLDNQIQIAHNVVIGKNTVIAAQCGIAGSSKIGENCQIGGQAGVSGHLTVGDNVTILGKSAVTSNVKSNTTVKGSPAFDALAFNKSYVHFKNLNNK